MRNKTIVLVGALLLASCSRGAGPPLSRDEFVAVMIELRQGARLLEPGEDFQPRRREILERRGVTEEELEAYVQWAGQEPARLREAFDEISAGLQVTEAQEE